MLVAVQDLEGKQHHTNATQIVDILISDKNENKSLKEEGFTLFDVICTSRIRYTAKLADQEVGRWLDKINLAMKGGR